VEQRKNASDNAQRLEWIEADELRRLVWQTKWRLPPKPNQPEKKPRRLSGEARCAWWVLWWDLGLWRGGALDVTAAQIATAIGDSDSRGGRRAIEALRDAGLLGIDAREKQVTGRYTVFMPDPRDVRRGRRQASDGQVELFDDDHIEQGETEPGSSPVADRVSEFDSAAVNADPGTPPVSNGRSVRFADRSAAPIGVVAAADVAQHPPPDVVQHLAQHVAQHPPPTAHLQGRSSPARERLEDLDLKGNIFPNLGLERLETYSAQVQVTVRGASGGGSGATSAAGLPTTAALPKAAAAASGEPAKVGDLFSQVMSAIDGRRGIAFATSLCAIVPDLWGDWADELGRELDGGRDAEHGGEPTPLSTREVARLVVAEAKRKRRDRPAAVYFTGAVNLWLQEHGRKRIFIKPRQPR